MISDTNNKGIMLLTGNLGYCFFIPFFLFVSLICIVVADLLILPLWFNFGISYSIFFFGIFLTLIKLFNLDNVYLLKLITISTFFTILSFYCIDRIINLGFKELTSFGLFNGIFYSYIAFGILLSLKPLLTINYEDCFYFSIIVFFSSAIGEAIGNNFCNLIETSYSNWVENFILKPNISYSIMLIGIGLCLKKFFKIKFYKFFLFIVIIIINLTIFETILRGITFNYNFDLTICYENDTKGIISLVVQSVLPQLLMFSIVYCSFVIPIIVRQAFYSQATFKTSANINFNVNNLSSPNRCPVCHTQNSVINKRKNVWTCKVCEYTWRN